MGRPLWQAILLAGLWAAPLSAAAPGPERVKDADMGAPDVEAWAAHGPAQVAKVEVQGARALQVCTQRLGQPGRRCGVATSLGQLQAGDLLELTLTYRVLGGGGLTVLVGVHMDRGLSALARPDWATVVARLPVRRAGAWRVWLLQSMAARRGEFQVRRLSVRVVQQGQPSRFPVVTDGDMEQTHAHLYAPYHSVRIAKDTQTFRAGRRSLHVKTQATDRPTSMYAGVAVGLGTWPAQTRLHVTYDIKVAVGHVTAIMARGAFDKTFQTTKPGDWQHVAFDYETPLKSHYTIYWTRRRDEPTEFWLDNVNVTAQPPSTPPRSSTEAQ